jgi:hypothetical protein
MARGSRNQFDALRQRDQALKKLDVSPLQKRLKHATGNLWSIHETHTVGYYADTVRLRPDQLIELFDRAGIEGLTPQHRLESETQRAFEIFLRGSFGVAQTVYSDDQGINEKIVVVQSISSELLKQLAHSPGLLHQLESRKFEELVARLLEDQGCEVTLTKRTRDGGYDVFGRMKTGPADLLFLAECKRYAPENRVGVEVIRGLYGVTEARRANLGLVITTSSFTKDAREEKVRIGPRIDLKDYSDLCDWLERYRGDA